MGWLLYDTVGTNYYPITNEKLVRQLSGLNYVTCKLENVVLASNTLVNVLDESGIVVFTGFIKKTADPTDDINRYEITERARELQDDLCDAGSYVYNFSIVTSSVNTIMDNTILNGTGWTRGSSDTTLMTQMSFYYETQFDTLFRVLVDYRDHFVWFNNTTKYVYFGSSRTDRTADDVVYISKNAEVDSNNRVYDKIIVIGANDSITAWTGAHGGTVKCYQMPEIKSSYEASKMVATLWSIMGTSNKGRVTCLLEPTSLYDEGDLVSIDGSNYIVYNVEMSSVGTKLVCDSRTTNIGDVFVEEKYKPKYDSATSGGAGVSDHGALSGLGDDDHTQYLLADGTRAMTGTLDMGGNSLNHMNNMYSSNNVSVLFLHRDAVGSATTIAGYDGNQFYIYKPLWMTADIDLKTNDLLNVGVLHTNNIDMGASDILTIYGDTGDTLKFSPSGNGVIDYDAQKFKIWTPSGHHFYVNSVQRLDLDTADFTLTNNTNLKMNGGDLFMNGNVIDQAFLWGTDCVEFTIDQGNNTGSNLTSVRFNHDGVANNDAALTWNKTLSQFALMNGVAAYAVVNIADPTDDEHAATKKYVDTLPGVDGVSFILDQDNAGAGVSSSYRFNRGSTDGDAAIWWDEVDNEFQFESDVGVTIGNIKVANIAASKVVTGDHGTAATDEVINVCYGTSATPPTANTTTEGALYIQYTA